MDYTKEYNDKLTTPQQAVKTVKSNYEIDYGTFAGQVVELDKALANRKNELENIYIRSAARVAGPPAVVLADPEQKSFVFNSGHFTVIDRKMHDQGLCYYIPILFREVPSYTNFREKIDVVMLATTPMNRLGYFNFGLHNTFTRSVIEKARHVILEVNSKMPWVPGGMDECVHISEVDAIVESDWDIPPIPEIPVTKIDQQIASLIMEELEDGCCIQLGIGGLPNALGKLIAKSDLKDLGVHTEMLCDAYLDMWESGKITGRRKTIDKGKMSFTFALGSQKLYDFLNQNPSVASYPVSYTNYPHIMAMNDKLISINGAVEVDIFGQVCSESVGARQISGTGGQVDFIEGAYMSRKGKSFICFPSTYKDENGNMFSRIKNTLSPGAIVTTTRSMVMYLATEYGIVNLKGKSTWERAESLINIAHPKFRDELIHEAEKLRIWTRSNKRPTVQEM